MNEKKVLLFHDESDKALMLEDRLTALLFDRGMADKARDMMCAENEDGDIICDFKTMTEIEEELEKNGIVFEAVKFEFLDYNVS
jgi:transcriptional/translational regulatory protein YebC/TACO1